MNIMNAIRAFLDFMSRNPAIERQAALAAEIDKIQPKRLKRWDQVEK